jgi:hypothetical protein
MKKTLFITLLGLISLFFFSCNEEIDPNKVEVTGTVAWVSGASGGAINAVAVQGASVSFYPGGSALRDKIGQATSDSQGKFIFEIAPGTYDIVAFKSGQPSDSPPPGSSSKSGVVIPENQLGKTFDIGEFLY